MVKLEPGDQVIAGILEREKILSIRYGYAYLDQFCTEDTYIAQRMKCERRYKTIVTLHRIQSDGSKVILHRLYLPFHQEAYPAKKQFFQSFPYCQETEFQLITIQHTDTKERKVWIIYETQGY